MPAKKDKCMCNLGWLVIAWILMALGIWALVAGFVTQFDSVAPASMATAQVVVPWYFGGVLLVGLGKMAKWKSCGVCMAHGAK